MGLLLVGLSLDVDAHRLDEYLQAARILISTEQIVIELDLTPGEVIAGAVVADIDLNRDGAVSDREGRAHAQRVLAATTLEIDGGRRPLVLVRGQIPDLDAMQAGVGTVRLQISAGGVPRTAGPHELVFRNNHRADVGVYLVNALTPATPRIRISEQRRDALQRELRVTYEVLPPVGPRWPAWWSVAVAGAVVGLAGRAWRRRGRVGPNDIRGRSRDFCLPERDLS